MSDYRLAVAGLVVLVCLTGCGGSGPFEYIPVTGQITYEDGSVIPAKSWRVIFTALDHNDPNVRPRPATASIDPATGKFDSATSYKYGDGLVPGKHRVALAALDASGKELKLFPKEYGDTRESPLIIDTANLPLEIKVPKP